MAADDHLSFHGNPRNIQYTTKVARLLNQTDKGIARIYGDESENFLERQYGRLFAVVDLHFTADTYDVGEVLLDTLEREFYSDLNRSVAESFEEALTAVNQTLADLAAEGQNDWVGKLNASVGVLAENVIHVSQVGSAHAYLVRGHSTTHITDGLSAPPGTPSSTATAKTFQNVAGGQLEVGDKLLFSTKELFNHVPLRDMQRYLALNVPVRAIRKLADQVLAQEPPEHLATVVVELTTIDLVSAEPVNHEPEEIVLGAPSRHFELRQRLKPLRPDSPVAANVETARKWVSTTWSGQARPALTHGVALLRHRIAVLQAKRNNQAPPPAPSKPVPTRRAAGTPEINRPEHAPRAARRAQTEQGAPHDQKPTPGFVADTRQRLSTAATTVSSRTRSLWQDSGIPTSKFGRTVVTKTAPLRTRVGSLPVVGEFLSNGRALYRNLALIIGFVFILSLVLSIRGGQAQKAEDEVRNQIREVEAIQAKAEASVIIKDSEGARAQAGEAKAKADQLSGTEHLQEEVARVQQSVNTSYDRIVGIITVNDQPLVDLGTVSAGKPINGIALAGGTIVAIGDGSPLLTVNVTNQELKTVNPTPNIAGSVKSLATASNGDVLLYTDKPTVYQLDPNSGAAAETPVGGGGAWEAGVAIDTVQQTVFLLAPSQNQIWRHGRTLSAYSKGEAYFGSGADIANAVDLVTGAQVYMLKSDGSVQQFIAGTPQAFKLTAPPAPMDKITEPKSLAVNFLANTVYVADPKERRVVEFNIQGQYTRQFKADAFSDIKDMVVDDRTNTLFILAGSKLYQVPLG